MARNVARNVATTDRVDREALLAFARDRHHVVLVTREGDGSPQLSPVTGGFPPRLVAGGS